MNERQETLMRTLPALLERAGVEAKVSFDRRAPVSVSCVRKVWRGHLVYRVTLPDYLDDAPPEVIASIVEACAESVEGVEPFALPPQAVRWLADPGFAMRRRGQWMARCGLPPAPVWVAESVESLERLGLTADAEVTVWPMMRTGASRIMRTGVVPERAEGEELSQGARDLLVWSAMCKASRGWPEPLPARASMLSAFPGRGAYEAELRERGLSL